MKMNDYLDQAKEKLKIESDYALANELGISRASICNYRKSKSVFDDYTAFTIGEIICVAPQKIIAETRAEVEKDDFKRDFWKEKAKEYGFVDITMNFSILLLMIISAFIVYGINNQGVFSNILSFIFNNNIYYAHKQISRKRSLIPLKRRYLELKQPIEVFCRLLCYLRITYFA